MMNFEQTSNKLANIFSFLIDNREFNHALQTKSYLSYVSGCDNTIEKVSSLLYHIANTQSQPKIDNLANFYKSIFENTDCMTSMQKFINKINPSKPLSFSNLYEGMVKQQGWGKKTAALFTKNIYHLHNGAYPSKLSFWGDVPQKISDNDTFYLPVDLVITAIFRRINNSVKWNFDIVNGFLKTKYDGQQIEVWDDLWFWGFITQKGSGENRVFEWNENKYWALKDSDKRKESISLIEIKSNQFLKILKENN